MRVEITTTSQCKREMHIEVPAETVSQAFNQAYGQLLRYAVIPGFRPGKAPRNLVKQRYQKEARDEVIRMLVPHVLRDAVMENKLPVVGEPEIDTLDLTEGQPMNLRLQIEVIPEFELTEYRGLEATRRIVPVTDETVDAALQRMREAQASLEPVEADRPAQDNDFAEFSLVGYELAEDQDQPEENATPLIEEHTEQVQLGVPQTLAAFSDNLRGLTIGETREFVVTFEEGRSSPELAGKRIWCKATLTGLRTKELPELDDAFAQGLPGEFADLADLKHKMRHDFEHRAEDEANSQVEVALLQQLIDRTGVEAPQTLVKERTQERIRMVVDSLIQRGVDPRGMNLDWQALFANQEELAKRDIQHSLILSKISVLESIDATEDEVADEISKMAQYMGESEGAVQARLTKEGGVDSIRAAIRQQKALRFLLDNARIQTETVTPSETQSEASES